MSKKSTLKDSQTDWERINAMRDEDIDTSDIPEHTLSNKTGQDARGGKPVSRGKVRVNILLDAEVVSTLRLRPAAAATRP